MSNVWNKRLPPDDQFIAEFEDPIEGGAAKMAKRYGVAERNVYQQRKRIEERIGRPISAPDYQLQRHRKVPEFPAAIQWDIEEGVVLVGSDCHYWPGHVSTAHMAFVHMCRQLKPAAVILNGDVMDGARISRFGIGQWLDYAHMPSVADEIRACQERLLEIEKACGSAWKAWTAGNHDLRLEARMIQSSPEFAEVHGTSLKDHFPHWPPCWAVFINDDVVVKHRWKSGIYAPRNNAMQSGRTMVTGHLHSQKVMPLTDYNGTRWGVDTGTMAEPYGPQFVHYTEASPVDWRSGFAVLNISGGKLVAPELVTVVDTGVVVFRGERIQVCDPAAAGWNVCTTDSSTQTSSKKWQSAPKKKSASAKRAKPGKRSATTKSARRKR